MDICPRVKERHWTHTHASLSLAHAFIFNGKRGIGCCQTPLAEGYLPQEQRMGHFEPQMTDPPFTQKLPSGESQDISIHIRSLVGPAKISRFSLLTSNLYGHLKSSSLEDVGNMCGLFCL